MSTRGNRPSRGAWARSSLPDPGPEAGLLLALAMKGPPGPLPGAQVREGLAGGLDWSKLTAVGARHGLLPHLFHRLGGLPDLDLPRQTRVDLWARHAWLDRHNEAMAAALGEILTALAARDIAAVPFKGPVLALEAYGDLAAREFADLDLLLRPRDLAPAQEALGGLGYVPEYTLAPAQEAAMLRARTQYHVLLFHPERAVAVELHWKSDPDHPVEADTDAWWASRPRLDFQGSEVLAFTPSELLLVLCIHGSKHHWSRLAWLADVAALLGKGAAFDWHWIRARAVELGASRRLALGLHLASSLLEAPIPPEIAAWAAQVPTVRRQAERIVAHLFDPEPWVPGPWTRLRMDLAQREGIGAKMRCVWYVVFTPTHEEWVRWPLPRGWEWLYPFLRVVRLMAIAVAPSGPSTAGPGRSDGH